MNCLLFKRPYFIFLNLYSFLYVVCYVISYVDVFSNKISALMNNLFDNTHQTALRLQLFHLCICLYLHFEYRLFHCL